MSCDPYTIICEILGQPADQMKNPANADNLCPFRDEVCVKYSHRLGGLFPVCSVFRKGKNDVQQTPIVVCPRRLYAADIYNDVMQNCWIGEKPKNPVVVHEIKMGKVGNVDMVIADLSDDGSSINNFVSIELQAVDITGSYEPAYSSIVFDTPLPKKPTYNFNYKNVEKRFINQLINKGFFHHHWNTRIIAVVQDTIYERLKASIDFNEVSVDRSDIIFLRYGMVLTDTTEGSRYELRLSGATGTTHSELMMSSLYQTPPPKEDFCKRIIKTYKSGM